MKKVIAVSGVLPDFNSFKIRVSNLVGNIYVVEGEEKNIDAYTSVFNDMVSLKTATDVQATIDVMPKTVPCPTCGKDYTPILPTVPVDIA